MSIPEQVNPLMNASAVNERAKVRPLIDFVEGEYQHILERDYRASIRNTKTRVVMTRHLISIGCTDITPYAARKLLKAYLEAFPDVEKEVIIQP